MDFMCRQARAEVSSVTDQSIITPLRPEAGRWSGLEKTELKDAMSRQERARRLGINCFLRGSYFHL